MISFFLSICFKVSEEVVNRKYIYIFGINITGKGLVCLRMKILQIRSLHDRDRAYLLININEVAGVRQNTALEKKFYGTVAFICHIPENKLECG